MKQLHCMIHKTSNHLCRPNEAQKRVTCCNNSALMADINQSRQAPWLIEMTSSDKPIEQQG